MNVSATAIVIETRSRTFEFPLVPWIVVPLLCLVGHAQEIPPELQPSIETAVDLNEITIGDDIAYTVTIRYDPTITIEASTPGMELGQFEIKEVSIGTPERQGGRMVRTDHYILSTYFTGDYTIPPLTVRFRTPSGEVGELSTDFIDIHVRSLTPEESEELTIRDIKSPTPVKGKSRWGIIGLIGIVVLLLVLVLVWLFFLRRREEVTVTLEPPLPAHERALVALASLRGNESLLTERRFKEFSTRLTKILRVYIHDRWGIVALDRTTDEILSQLRGEGIARGVSDRFLEVFSACDLMKFARHEIDRESALRLIDRAVWIVEETRRDIVGAPGLEVPPSLVATESSNSEQGGVS